MYNLTSVPPEYAAAVAQPALSLPSPSNDAAVDLTLSGLSTGVTYTLLVWAVSQGRRVKTLSLLTVEREAALSWGNFRNSDLGPRVLSEPPPPS